LVAVAVERDGYAEGLVEGSAGGVVCVGKFVSEVRERGEDR